MKRLIWVILAIFLSYGASEAHRPQKGRNFSLFFNSLQGHGEWINLRSGTVWRPFRVDQNWRPYVNGHWIWTDYGWYWSSNEPFGWATYHYGRWSYDDYYGWIWNPGDEWGPAWVEWRYDDDYIGWAPLPPTAQWSLSVGITFGRPWRAPYHYWNFVPCRNFSSVSVVNYIQPADVSRRIYGRTRSAGSVRSVGNRMVNDAVRLDRVQRRSAEPIRKIDLVDRTAPGQDRVVRSKGLESLEIYRPNGKDVRVNDTRSSGQARDSRSTAQPRQPGQTDMKDRNDRNRIDSRGNISPGKRPERQAATRSEKQDNQRSLEEGKSKRIYRNDPAETRNQNRNKERSVQGSAEKRSAVAVPRPSIKRESPAPRQSGSKKQKPDG